ncbi:MAG: carbohydrate binding domain-containing protein [Planctomycetota bacterium]
MNQTRTHQLVLCITLVTGMILTSSAYSQEVENLLMDGGFEEPVSGWGLASRAPAAATFTIDTEEKRVGQASARIDITNVGDGSSVHTLTLDNNAGIAVEANKTYTVDLWTKAEADRTLIIDALLNQDPWSNLFRVRDLPVTTEWTRIHHTFQADATMSPVVFLFSFVDSTTTIWLDHVRFYEGEYNEEDGVPELAYDPDPADAAVIEATWANLSWRPGSFALTHDLYFGTSFDDVNSGAEETFAGNLATTSHVVGFIHLTFPAPDGLIPGTTYYWRVDEVNEAEPNSPWVGDIWSFSIAPKTAYSPDPIDGAEFVDLDATLIWTPGLGAKLHTVYLGDNYEAVDSATEGSLQGVASYKPSSPLEAEKVYYWRVDEFDAFETHKGDIWAFTTPGAVGNPRPANGDQDVHILTTLAWTPADNAASSDLYFGTDADAVGNAAAASPEYAGNKALGSESHDPGKLALGESYYWRVDAVYPDKTVKGLLWSFATADFILVDDFESYNDFDPPDPNSNRIFDKWIDGFGTATNGALVGNDFPPYAETTIVHGGAQSMIYRYDNAGKTSEATLTLVWPRDWTEEGVTKLSLWHNGSASNAADRMYVALNGTSAIYHDDPATTQIEGWTEWLMDLATFGVDLTTVNTITVGIGTKNAPAPDGGTGTLYFDDIRLYR